MVSTQAAATPPGNRTPLTGPFAPPPSSMSQPNQGGWTREDARHRGSGVPGRPIVGRYGQSHTGDRQSTGREQPSLDDESGGVPQRTAAIVPSGPSSS